jgi:hypothetical protein
MSAKTRKVVINAQYGGFSLSNAALARLCELGHPAALEEKARITNRRENGGIGAEFWNALDKQGGHHLSDLERDDPLLVQVVKELGRKADGFCARLKIVSIPADVKYQIEEYDGLEWVAEEHRTWG